MVIIAMLKILIIAQLFRRGGQQPPPPPDKKDKAEMAFRLYDKDKDGYITKGEMVKLSKTLTKEQVEKVNFQQLLLLIRFGKFSGIF
jgi:hypothetical protein